MFSAPASSWGDDLQHQHPHPHPHPQIQEQQHPSNGVRPPGQLQQPPPHPYPHQPRAAIPPLDFATQFSPAELEAAMHSLSPTSASSSPPVQYDLFPNPPFQQARYRSNSAAASLPSTTQPNSYDLLYSSSSSSSPFHDPLPALHTGGSGFQHHSTLGNYGLGTGNSSPLTPSDVHAPRSQFLPPPGSKPADFSSSAFTEFPHEGGQRRSSAPESFSSYPIGSDFPAPFMHGAPQSASQQSTYDFQAHSFSQPAVPSQLHPKSFDLIRSLKPDPALFDDSKIQYTSHPTAGDLGVRNLSMDDRMSSMTLQSPIARSGVNDLTSFIRPFLEQYVNTDNRIGLGEKTIIVMSSKVAQKSYGTEKRFLCPPPTAILIGNSWWSESTRAGEDAKQAPPRCVISISGEPTPQEASIEWTSATGKAFDIAEPPTNTTFLGRCVGKQLFISDVDEKKKKVEALVKVMAPASEDEPERVIGTFSSRPIKVISKPSKKRQSAKNLELCINHGSTISLFHRLRSQTVSTKYLCVSGSGASFKGSDGQFLLGVDQRSRSATPSFIARTASWDPFIMYIVDVNKPSSGLDTLPPPPPPQPEYPSPPPNAISFTNNGSQIPIYYNQTVVLQCLTSGVVSPVLIIRKVDHATIVVGGGLQEGAKGVPDHYCAPGEVCGDPVSQLHKIAFEVYDSNKSLPHPGTPGPTGSFLSCNGEKVNTFRPNEGRQWVNPTNGRGSDSPSIPSSPLPSTPSSIGTHDYFPSSASSVSDSPTSFEFPSSDGGRVKKNKQRPGTPGSGASGAPKATSVGSGPKGRRRHSSASSVTSSRNGATTSDHPASSGALWQVDIGETSVWTIVGTDQVRYNFYVPPHLFGTSPHISSSPYFPVPLKPVTPFPGVVKYLPPDRAAEAPKLGCPSRSSIAKAGYHGSKTLTLYGENFSKGDPLSVFFGHQPSSFVEIRCTEVLGCLPPEEPLVKRVPIILVRGDGVIFPSNVLYP